MAMFVGIGTLELRLYEINSLKEKSSVIRRILRRTRDRFRISIQEVELLTEFEQAVLGFASVGSHQAAVDKMMNNIIEFIEELRMADVLSADFTVEGF